MKWLTYENLVKRQSRGKWSVVFDSINILSGAYLKVGIMLDLLDIGTWYKILLIEKEMYRGIQIFLVFWKAHSY